MRTMFAFLVMAVCDYLESKYEHKLSEGSLKFMAWLLFIGIAACVLTDIKEFLK